MKKSGLILSLVLTLCVATITIAQDDAKSKRKDKAQTRALKSTTTQMMKAFEAAKLTDEQKEKATAVIKKHIKDLAAARKELAGMLTPEQQKEKTAAFKKAKEDGLKGKKANEAVMAAMKLSDEKLEQYQAAAKKPQEITAKIKAAITELLTDEQKAALPKAGNRGGKANDKAKGKGKRKKGGDDGGLQTVSLKLPNMT